jgi:hypothetical protein
MRFRAMGVVLALTYAVGVIWLILAVLAYDYARTHTGEEELGTIFILVLSLPASLILTLVPLEGLAGSATALLAMALLEIAGLVGFITWVYLAWRRDPLENPPSTPSS